MNPRIARWAGWTMVLSLVFALGLLYVLSSGKLLVSQRGALGGSLVKAEFKNAWPLVPGMTVRVSGAVAGTVESVDLTDQGTADVGLRLTRDVAVPRTDASAAIRQHDILGDTYVALELGDEEEALEGSIPVARTIALPRLDELFSTFREPERQGVQALMTELSLAVEKRGSDLNEAMLQIRPGMEALDDLLAELDGQEVDLRAVVTDAQRLTGQLADSTQDIEAGTDALDGLLTSAAAQTPQLDRALDRAPEGMAATRRTLTQVGQLADRAQPLARTLADAAPELRAAAPLIAPFARDAATSVRVLAPVFDQLRRTLVAAKPVTGQLKDLDPVDVLLPASGLLEVLSPVFGDGAKALFGASSYGTDPKGQTGLGAVAVERGDQPTTPNVDPRRMWMRTGVVLSCETFGIPIRPGCLARLLGQGVDALVPVNLRAGQKQAPGAKDQPDDPQLQVLDYLMR
ncbi:MlaD family protein [Svornostia abyssi]|uniref:MlaD family protein n=1 Tax=Svornostia abyssi TaxID=2898438 RepID=A0ABY5PG70_9ACTN|nr:MlaD family protein [Parviterribacteraceae bacterium J379]